MAHLKQHKELKHEGIRYPCDQCNYAATTVQSLKVHKEANHEGIRYPCDQCDLIYTSLSDLNKHQRSKHEGIRYPCDKCKYGAITMTHLKRHKESKHVGIRYPCDQCKYAATRNSYLKSHKKAKHSEETVMDNDKHSISNILRRKVNVRIKKLDYDKYMRIQNKVHTVKTVSSQSLQDTENTFVDLANSAEPEVKKEDITEYDPLKTPEKKENSESNDLESKIEIEEDMIFKTESADLSEFIQETNEDASIFKKTDKDDVVDNDDEDDESDRKEDEKEDEFCNRVTIEEFFPHLSSCQDSML